ncbi:uncharacterized protein LOC141532702 [Cotesia typhae]|uniref:uncharacterized protein LOC141532702 n=1 Tax=Cotesia typhae TaxID=2053667 RepID=UPI003D68F0B8
MDTKCICRLCGKQVSKTLVNIFDPDNNFDKQINVLLPVYVHEDDCLPKYMCNDCHDNVLKFHKFYLTTLETDIELKSQLPWMQKQVEETHDGIPMVQYLNSKTLAIATELENYNCYSTKLPEFDLIKTIDSNLVSVNSCPCSYSCSSCLHVNIEDPNAFDSNIDELSDSNNEIALDPLAPEIPVDVKNLGPPNNVICTESKVDVEPPDVKPTESFHRTLRPRQKSTELPPKKSSFKSKVRKGKRKVHFSINSVIQNNSKDKNLKIDSKVWQRVEIKTERLDKNFKFDDKNLRRKNKTESLVTNNSVVKVNGTVNCEELKLKNDLDNERITNHGHINKLFERTDSLNKTILNDSIINSNSNDLTVKPNLTNKPIIIKKECMNELNLMDVSVKLEKINFKNVDDKRELEKIRRPSVEVKSNCKEAKVARRSSAGGKKRKRKRKKLNKQLTSNKKNIVKVNINNLYETLNLSSSSGRVECDLCKKSFATREVFNLHYCCNN